MDADLKACRADHTMFMEDPLCECNVVPDKHSGPTVVDGSMALMQFGASDDHLWRTAHWPTRQRVAPYGCIEREATKAFGYCSII